MEGEAADTPLNVPSGTTEAFFVHQSAYFKPNEGMFYFQVDGVTHGEGNFCMVYWRIDNRRRPTFRPNMLGVGCQEDLYAMKIVADEIEDLGKDAEEGVRDFLEYHSRHHAKLEPGIPYSKHFLSLENIAGFDFIICLLQTGLRCSNCISGAS